MDRDVYYSVPEASRILSVSQTRVRQLIRSGELAAEKQDDDSYQIRKDVLHTFYEAYEPRTRRPSKAAVWPQELTELIDRTEDLARQLGEAQGQMRAQRALTSVAESTLQTQLKREQVRADRYEAELREVRKELEAERSKGWWQRLFS